MNSGIPTASFSEKTKPLIYLPSRISEYMIFEHPNPVNTATY